MLVNFEVQIHFRSIKRGIGTVWKRFLKNPAPFRNLRVAGSDKRGGHVSAVAVVDDSLRGKRRPTQNEIRFLLIQKLSEFTSVPVKGIGFKQLDEGVM